MEMCGVIFDLDGVLCHTDHYHYLAWKALADRLGLPFDERVNDRLRGVSRMDSLEIVLAVWTAWRSCSAWVKSSLPRPRKSRWRRKKTGATAATWQKWGRRLWLLGPWMCCAI